MSKSKQQDIAVRVRRRDGKPMKRSEAEQVMSHFRRHRSAPRAYIITGVLWSRPGRRAKEYGAEELEGAGLARVLDAVAGDKDAWKLRLGSVKE